MAGDIVHPVLEDAAAIVDSIQTAIAADPDDTWDLTAQADALIRVIAAVRWVAYATAEWPSGHSRTRAPSTPPIAGAWLLEDAPRAYLMEALADLERLA